MCNSGLDSDEHQQNYHKADDIAFELSILMGTGRTSAVFDSDQYINSDYNDYDDYGHGL